MSIMFDVHENQFSDAQRRDLGSRVLVVVPVLNEAAYIDVCLRALNAQYAQFIVADGGSTDGTQRIVEALAREFSNISLVENPGRLQSAGVNAGARRGDMTRDILIRCDAHADYPVDYVLKVAHALDNSKADSLVVPMDAVGESCFQKANAWVVDTPLGSGGSAHRGGMKSGYVDHGHHAAFRREKFLALGGYDESFSHNEDAEYDARLRKAGGRIFLNASIRIGYYPRADLYSLWKQYYGYGHGRARNLFKNREFPRIRQLIPVANVFALSSFLALSFLNPVWLVWPIVYLGILAGMSIGISFIKKSICGLWGGVALGCMHVAWGIGFLSGACAATRRGAA